MATAELNATGAVATDEQTIVDVFAQRMSTAHAAKSRTYGFDPTVIVAIISAIMTLLQNCKKPTPATLKKPGLFGRARLNAEIKREMPDLRQRERADLIDDVIDVANESSDHECERFAQACGCN